MIYETHTNNKHINTMVPPDDPNAPSTPTITQPPGTPSPYIPTNEVVVMPMPLIRHSNSLFITPWALHSQAIDVSNDPIFFLHSYGDNDNPFQSPEAKPCMNMKVTSRLTRLRKSPSNCNKRSTLQNRQSDTNHTVYEWVLVHAVQQLLLPVVMIETIIFGIGLLECWNAIWSIMSTRTH